MFFTVGKVASFLGLPLVQLLGKVAAVLLLFGLAWCSGYNTGWDASVRDTEATNKKAEDVSDEAEADVANCHDRGPAWSWDVQTGRCVRFVDGAGGVRDATPRPRDREE